MKCLSISCFDHYPTRMESINAFFADHGYDVTYVITDYQHFEKKRYSCSYSRTKTIQLHVPAYKKNISPSRLISHYVFSKKLGRVLKKETPDIIYCMFPPNSLLKEVAKYKEAHSCKLVLDCYDMWPESFPYSNTKGLLKLPFAAWASMRNKYLHIADLIITVSEESKKALQQLCGIPVSVLRPALALYDMPVYTYDTDKEIRFLYLGNINHIVNIDLCERFLSEMAKRKKTILHIIGSGQFMNDLLQRLQSARVEVVTHGVIFDAERKKEIFSMCHLGLNIPREEIQSTMPLKAIEYMRFGLPFINTGIGDIKDIVEKREIGLNLKSEDVSDTCERICQLQDNEFQQLSDNCYQCYRDEFMNQNYDEVFAEVLK